MISMAPNISGLFFNWTSNESPSNHLEHLSNWIAMPWQPPKSSSIEATTLSLKADIPPPPQLWHTVTRVTHCNDLTVSWTYGTNLTRSLFLFLCGWVKSVHIWALLQLYNNQTPAYQDERRWNNKNWETTTAWRRQIWELC